MPQTTVLEVVALKQETPDTISIHFHQPAVHRLWYKAGQFLTLIVNVGKERHLRSYSICTERRLDETLAITVRRQPGGLVSNYLHDQVSVGDRIEAIKPMGSFFLETSIKNNRHIWMVAGGSGITPLMSILRATLFHEPQSRVSLLYSNREETRIIFRDWLADLEKRFPDRLTVWYTLTGQEPPEKEYDFRSGRIDKAMVGRFYGANRVPGVPDEVFLCGPLGLMKTAREAFQELGVADEAIHEERFVGEAPALPDNVDPLAPSREVEIRAGAQVYRVLVPPGSSILDAALSQGHWLPHSCRLGHCSTCIGKLLEGEVEMRSNEALTPEDIEAGYVLTCSALPLNDHVVVQTGL